MGLGWEGALSPFPCGLAAAVAARANTARKAHALAATAMRRTAVVLLLKRHNQGSWGNMRSQRVTEVIND